MSKYKIIINGSVVNTIVIDDTDIDSYANTIGASYEKLPDEEVIQDQYIPSWKITKLAFKNRFPLTKWKLAKQASISNIDLSDFFESFSLAGYINLQDASTIAYVNAMGDESVDVSIRLSPDEIYGVLNMPARPDEMI